MVVGGLPGNLGYEVGLEAGRSREWDMIRIYDLNGERMNTDLSERLDMTNRREVVETIGRFGPTDIVCTAGINCTEPTEADIPESVRQHMEVNYIGPMLLLNEALFMWSEWHPVSIPEQGFNFVAVSSNSAHIARSQSTGYCASKAALSMGLRCIARRVAGSGVKIWGYEPGFIDGTPMSEATALAFPDTKLHRIPGGEGLNMNDLADRIVADLIVASHSLNGVMFRIDGGEQ